MTRTLWFSENRALSSLPAPLQRPARGALVARRHLGFQSDDLLIAGHPKSGTTFLRIVLASALSGRELDFDSVRAVSLGMAHKREMPAVVPGGGRLLKSHEPPRFVPFTTRPKVLHLVRDGRDVAVSYYYNFRRLGYTTTSSQSGDTSGTEVDLSTFVDLFGLGRVGPYGSWQDHVGGWADLEQRGKTPVTTLRYEDVLADPQTTIGAALDALEIRVDPANIARAVENNTVAKMREKEAGSAYLGERSTAGSTSFIRTAKHGAWKGQLDGAVLARFEARAGRALTRLGYELSPAPVDG